MGFLLLLEDVTGSLNTQRPVGVPLRSDRESGAACGMFWLQRAACVLRRILYEVLETYPDGRQTLSN